MTKVSGRSPLRGSGHSGSAPSPVPGLGHPASVPNARDIERIILMLTSLPQDLGLILEEMGDGERCHYAADVAEITKVPVERVRQVHRALRTLGFADFGVLCDVDSEQYQARGSGYWLTLTGVRLRNALSFAPVIEARRAETHSGAVEDESAVGAAETPNPQSGEGA